MAGAQRQPDDSLIAQLLAEGKSFSFFQAVQLLHRLSPNLKPVGDIGPPDKEVVRFKVNPALSFSAGDIESIVAPSEGATRKAVEITTNFLGLVGAASPLAFKFTEDVIAAQQDDEFSLTAFYDIFHHRLLSLYYRAWKKYRLAAGFRTDGSDPFTRRALAFVGVDPGASTPRDGLPPRLLLTLAPILAQRTRSARTLEIALRRLLPGAGIEIQSFVERQVRIPVDQRVKLGVSNSTLNNDFTVGMRVLDRGGRFRVKVGPVDYEDFEALMPGGENYPVLRQVVNQFTRGVLEPELEVCLAEDQSPRFQLGNRRGALLGTTTQLVTRRTKPMRMRVILAEDTRDAVPHLVPDGDD